MQNNLIENLYQYLSKKSGEAYKDPLLIANIVLSKQLTSGRILETYIENKNPPKITFVFIAKKIFLYVIKNSLQLVMCIVTNFMHKISGQNFYIKKTGELIILDTFFLADKILEKKRFEDTFFPGLSQYLTKMKKVYVYTPRLSGLNNPFKLFKVFKILKNNNVPALTYFQVLGLADYFEALRFLFFYPFSVIRFMKNLGNNYEDEILRYGLWENLGSSVLETEIRFLFGKRLSFMKFSKIKCIGWYENQASDKNFYRGLKHTLGKVEIIGTQFFLRCATYLFIKPDEREIMFNVVPDRILVDGPAKCFESNKIKVDVGPTLRDDTLFDDMAVDPSNGDCILVLMSYYNYITDYALRIVCDVAWNLPVKIKFHPTTNLKKFEMKVPKSFLVTNEELSELLPKVRVVVGGASGAQLLLAARGIPVIDISHPTELNHDHMPLKIGKGVIWDRATSAEGVTNLLKQFEESLKNNPSKLREESLRLKELYFSEPTEGLIDRAFGLS